MTFENKVVVISGAAGNLGRAVARHFEERGASAVLLDRQIQRVDGGSDPERRHVAAVDLLDNAAVQAAIAAAVARFGRLDILCHLAGGFRMGDAVHETDPATWDSLFDVNVRSFVEVARAVIPQFVARRSGKVVTVGAYSAGRGQALMGAYCASKSALMRCAEAMSAELRHQNINVNCVLPSLIDTPENRKAMPTADPDQWVSPDAIADVIGFLSSDASSSIHGALIPVTGLG